MGQGSGPVVQNSSITIESLRFQINEIRKIQPGARRLDYPENFCRDVATAVCQGVSVLEISKTLNVALSVVHRWHKVHGKVSLAAYAPRPGFLPVKVKSSATVPNHIERLFDVVTPSGYTIKGMRLEDISRLQKFEKSV